MSAAPQPAAFTAAHPTPYSRHRFHLLDGLRGVAAIMVVSLHAAQQFHAPLPFYNACICVDFFFCLSGFILAFSYGRRFLQGLSFRQFFALRLLRLYPMYFLCMMIAGGYSILHNLLTHHTATRYTLWLLEALVFIPNFSHRFTRGILPYDISAWSLFFELLASAVFGVLAVHKKLSATWLAITATVSFFLLTLAVRQGVPIESIGGWIDTFLYGFPRAAFSFAIGILLFRLYQRIHAAGPLPSTFTAVATTVALVLFFLTNLAPWTWMRTESFYLGSMLVTMPLIVLTGALASVPRAVTPLCSFLGDISYPVYLFHLMCVYPLVHAPARFYAHTSTLVAIAIVTLLATVFSSLVGRYAEAPLRRYWTSLYNRRYARLLTHATGTSLPEAGHA